MKTKGLIIFTLATLLAAPLWADSLTLKDGTKYEGTVVLETEEEILFKIQLTAGLKEERSFKRSDVEKLVQSTAADKKYEELQSYVPTPDRLTLSAYRKRVAEVNKFLTAFKSAKYESKVKVILKTLNEELALVEEGGLKLNGAWLTKEEVGSNAYEIDAQMAVSDMTELTDKGSLLGSLRQYETLKKEYPGTQAFQQAIPLTQQVLDDYEAAIKLDLSTLKSRIETRDAEFAKLTNSQKKDAMDHVASLSMVYKKRLDFEKQKQMKWYTLEPYHEAPMRDALKTIESERSFLEKLDTSKLPDSSELYRTAWEAASNHNRTRVEELAPELKSAGIQAKHFKLLQERLIEKEAEAEAAGESLTPESETPEVEEEMAETTTDESDANDGSSDEETAEDTANNSSDDDGEESAGMLRPILFGVIGLVVVVALAVAFTGKKKTD